MFVGRIMHRDLVTVSPDTTLARAEKILEEKQINHLLIMNKNGGLAGILSDRDVKRSLASSATTLSAHELNYLLDKVTVGMIMSSNLISITPGTTIERAASIMQENRINALPVIEDGRTTGIITSSDVMGVLLEAIGIEDPGESLRFVVLIDHDRIGFLAEITALLKEHGVNIRSVFAWPDREHKGVYHLVLRVNADKGEQALTSLTGAGFTILTEYIPDIGPFLADNPGKGIA